MALNQALLLQLFPKVEFAFFGNYINRYRRHVLQKRLPSIDLILAVENSQHFHEQNLKRNKDHYTYFARTVGGRAIHKMQEYGARIHFNEFKTDVRAAVNLSEDDESMSNGSLKIRYGVIELDDMLRDLQHWETLLTSSFMQRPHETLICDEKHKA